jgi:hypothetical protein
MNDFEDGGWALVRRVRQGGVWYQANDNLLMREQYGISLARPSSNTSHSIPVPTWISSGVELLLSTGDLSLVPRVALYYMTEFRAGDMTKWMITPWGDFPSQRSITKSSASQSECKNAFSWLPA